tara:strand:+ start:197 stop:874 length:678 start_codon:yes stop_codon:yes gene_type:complete
MTPSYLRVSHRRRKRTISAIKYIFNPCVWILTSLALITLLEIIKQPTPFWQYLIGLPLALLLLGIMVGGLLERFEGETIYIISENPIPDISFSMGKGTSIAANIEFIDQFLIDNGMRMLSSFCETKDSTVWYSAEDGINIFSEIKNSAEKIVNKSSNRSRSNIITNLQKEIFEECNSLLKSLEDIRAKRVRFRIYLHEQIHGGNLVTWEQQYKDGYCLSPPRTYN